MKVSGQVVLRNISKKDSFALGTYLKGGGYEVWRRLLREGSAAQVIDQLKRSGLRGCGGAGFPTGAKWEMVAGAAGSPKYVVCNADEGEPGTFKDRRLMEQDPHRLLEGIAIAGFAVGAGAAYIYLRGEYDCAWARLSQALREAESQGILGDRACGSAGSMRIYLRRGAGGYVCGEETALLESLEGKRGIPRLKPPFPTTSGLWGKPTLVNNVETLARVPLILAKGPDWYRRLGKNGAAGTKVYCLSGQAARPGTYELPLGSTARELVYGCGGGLRDGRPLQAFCPGGISSGFLPATMLDIALDYDPLAKAGSMLGSGAVILMDESVCMVAAALSATRFFADESCGECTPCRAGTARATQLLAGLACGRGTLEDVEALRELAQHLRNSSRCGLGQAASFPILTSLAYFGEEYEAHLRLGKCPRGAAPPLAPRVLVEAAA